MVVPVPSTIPIPNAAANVSDVNRRSANFEPSIWGDHFLSYATSDSMETEKEMERVRKLKEQVKKMVVAPVKNPSEKLELINAIQRLGVAYHFESEIEEILQQINTLSYHYGDHENDFDLCTVALRFRLLRQQDMFSKFKDAEGKFKESLVDDVRGMLSLYEATHLRVRGEDILDEALAFTTTHLERVASNMSHPLSHEVAHALNRPIRRGLPRLEARYYMSIYPKDPLHNEVLLTFAKLDFNFLQQVHKKEVSYIARWWKQLEFAKKLPFARDRVIECYFWILGVYFEPQYYLARRMVTKVIAMTSVIDDIYDVHGTIEELDIFTEAVERWDICMIDQLPAYMQFCYQALLDVYSEIEEEMTKLGKSYRVDYAKQAMKYQVRAYFEEAKWFHKKHIPKMEEYMHVALVTSGHGMLAATSFAGMGDEVTKHSFDWLISKPTIERASSLVCRLMDDVVSHKFEQKRGHVASAVECYMKQFGATEEEAVNEFRKQVSDAWKDINEECLYPTSVPMPLLVRIVNLARVIDVVYKDEDGYTHASIVLKELVASMLINPVSL
ncbi:(-)-germacrene D synthase-like isoform X2 [Ziziphus jujuba]|uniref:(-)-germacrene D synthase-like isoform X2 n=1 Tax=Ziziphus jujuba TaxID=326968 RepID=A0ABM4A5A8_ZIZJJ|nr:(-)-germacrene D synthase-like isoform X2 [Ziziphus jujuba]